METAAPVSASPAGLYLKKAGCFASTQAVPISFKLMAYPMERIRLLMQTQHVNRTFEGSSFS
ncbi:Mitochondrial ADP/ATP translocase, partial [Diplonema papillatum]